MDPNNPSQNQNQNQNTHSPNQNMGFGLFSRLLRNGLASPTIPNQPQFSPTQSPPINFHQINQNVGQQNYIPQPMYFTHNLNDPRTFLAPEFEQPNFFGGGSSQQPTQEVVQETQEVPQTAPTAKKRAPRKKATSGCQDEKIPWTDEELVALADAWCTTSQDEIRGNDQKADGYWTTIRAKFAATLGKPENYRSVDSLTSKWTQMKTKLTKFNGIYMRISRNPPSGWNELKMLDEALKLYKLENRKNPFTLKHVWDRVRFERKWLAIGESGSLSSGSKRSFVDLESSMGSDAHVNVDLNQESDAINVDDVNDEVDPLHTRPPRGRDKAKRIAKFGDYNEAKAKHREKIEKSIEAHLASIEEKKAEKERLKAEQAEFAVKKKRNKRSSLSNKNSSIT